MRLILASMLLGSAVSAQAPADACAELRGDAANQPDPSLMDRNGIHGMWFSMPTSRLMLCEVRTLRLESRDRSLVDQELALWGQRVDNLHEQIGLMTQARTALETAIAAAERRARDAEAERDAWYRSPFLWFALGGVAAAALVALAVGVLGSL